MSNHLQHKLFNYHAQPRAEVWEKIVVALDDESEKPFPERLINYELEPPPFIWDNIAAALYEEAPVIPLKKRFSKPIRYGAVAASLLFAALLINLLLTQKSVSSEGDIISGIKPNSSVPQPSQKALETFNSSNYLEGNEAASAFPHTNGEENIPIRIITLRSNNKKVNPRFNQVVANNNNSAVEFEFLNRYSIFSKNTGEAFRVSKKLFNLFLCSEVNEYCKLNIEMVKGRMASPSVLASADFPGVLELLQSMNNQ